MKIRDSYSFVKQYILSEFQHIHTDDRQSAVPRHKPVSAWRKAGSTRHRNCTGAVICLSTVLRLSGLDASAGGATAEVSQVMR